MLLLTDYCITGEKFHCVCLMDTFKAKHSDDLFAPNENSSSLNCAVCPIPYSKRAGPHIGAIHKLLRRATSLCSETAINDKQGTFKMSHGKDENTTFLCCSKKQTFLVVPHIILPLTQMQTNIHKQDLIRIGTRMDAFHIFLLM